MGLKYLVAAGSNLSHGPDGPEVQIEFARRLIATAFTIVNKSRLYRTPAYPKDSGPEFVNAAFEFEASIPPQEMLDFLHSVEAVMGRKRQERWGPRVIDLDLIAAGIAILPDTETFKRWRDLDPDDQKRLAPDRLILPHPRLQDRAFVLLPLRDIAPDWQHPVSHLTVRQMCEMLSEEDLAACKVIAPGEAPAETARNRPGKAV